MFTNVCADKVRRRKKWFSHELIYLGSCGCCGKMYSTFVIKMEGVSFTFRWKTTAHRKCLSSLKLNVYEEKKTQPRVFFEFFLCAHHVYIYVFPPQSFSCGVVPYLGTYLTVLTMLDTALTDSVEVSSLSDRLHSPLHKAVSSHCNFGYFNFFFTGPSH